MSTPIVTNPTTFTITDSNAVGEGVTSFKVDFGRASGQYTLTADVPLDKVTFDGTSKYAGKIADLHEQLGAGQWFCAVRAVSANGVSLTDSPEAMFTIVPPPPSAPEAFTVA